MKWVLVNSQKSLLQEYHLVEDDKCIVIIKYNPAQHSARVSCGGSHRLFFIESTGSLTGKYLFKNEYDMEIGHMLYDRSFGKEGSVTIESRKYEYQISTTPFPELVIYDKESGRTLANCELNDSSIPPSQQNSSVTNNFLLLGLCWYLFLPVSKEKLEYAA